MTKLQKLEERIREIFFVLKNWKFYRYWKRKKNGEKFRDLKRGAGYYRVRQGEVWRPKMQSGRIGVFELVDYTNFNNPNDMIEESWWDFIKYEDCKPIRGCTFREYMFYYVWIPAIASESNRLPLLGVLS